MEKDDFKTVLKITLYDNRMCVQKVIWTDPFGSIFYLYFSLKRLFQNCAENDFTVCVQKANFETTFLVNLIFKYFKRGSFLVNLIAKLQRHGSPALFI